MSICKTGLASKIDKNITIPIKVTTKHPLIKLANSLDWEALAKLVLPDLKNSTSKLQWWMGRKLKLRTHLGVYLLQQLLNEKDRGMEKAVKENGVYQVFCGKTVVEKWHCPDHTKIESFRSRLSPETQCQLANSIAVFATRHKFANPEHLDIDSTVQEPDMQFPATAHLLVKTGIIARHIQKWCIEWLPEQAKKIADIDLKKIKAYAKEHYFIKRKRGIARSKEKDKSLVKLWEVINEVAWPIINMANQVKDDIFKLKMTKRQEKIIDHFTRKAPLILEGLYERCFEGLPRKIDTYSYFRDDVHCFNKMKHHKACEFGRQFQIGRIGNNFVYSIPNSSLHMPDAFNFKPMLQQHIELFQTPIESVATDKGYYSKDNEKVALDFKIDQVGVQRPIRKLDKPPDNPIDDEQLQALINRRAGIEPIIGHLKRHWQLGRSRMKSDRTTESSGYCAMLGFNLRQMMRHLDGEVININESMIPATG